jgi:transcriptional regulator with XRE-family HTH domain
MTVTLRSTLAKLPPARRARVEARAAELMAEELSLRALRAGRRLTQKNMAALLGVEQATVSRLERRGDMMVSTLRKTIRAMGGELDLVARFPGRPAIRLTGLAEKAGKARRSAAAAE